MEQAIRSILDEKFEEGERAGIKKGARRILEVILRSYDFEISEDIQSQLRSASMELLEEWHLRLTKGESPQDIFD